MKFYNMLDPEHRKEYEAWRDKTPELAARMDKAKKDGIREFVSGFFPSLKEQQK